MANNEVVSAPPVFFLHDEAPDDVTHVDICQAAERLVGFGSIVGAQRLGGLWRLYPINREIRAKLLTLKLLIRGRSIPLRSQNPFSIRDKEGKEIPSTRLSIDGLPVSIASSDLEGYLQKAGASFRSHILWEKARDEDGKLTRWVTGRRYVWIDLPTTPLPHRIQVGSFYAKLFYREQPKPVLVCFHCGKEGHRKGDPQCLGPEGTRIPDVGLAAGKGGNNDKDTDSETDETSSDEMEEESEGQSEGECFVKHNKDEEGKEPSCDEASKEVSKENKDETGEEEEDGDKTIVNEVDGIFEESSIPAEKEEKGNSEVSEQETVGKKKAQKEKKKKRDNTSPVDQGKHGRAKGNERGRPLQTTISRHFAESNRTPSLKRQNSGKLPVDGNEAQRPRI